METSLLVSAGMRTELHRKSGTGMALLGIGANCVLAAFKITAGVIGGSYALVADGIESAADIVSSFVVWNGLRIASTPPDEEHPYGHGKAESLAGLVVSVALLCAAALIAWQSVNEIFEPKRLPAWWTLLVLVVVIVVKEFLFRMVHTTSTAIKSTSLKGDAWHHRSDALTSVAAFIGISIALIGGEAYASADAWASLAACAIIAYNAVIIFRPALHEVMDGTVDADTIARIRKTAEGVDGVLGVEKCRVRKSGLHLQMDIHVEVDGDMTVTEGHSLGHKVKDALLATDMGISDVVVHIEPKD